MELKEKKLLSTKVFGIGFILAFTPFIVIIVAFFIMLFNIDLSFLKPYFSKAPVVLFIGFIVGVLLIIFSKTLESYEKEKLEEFKQKYIKKRSGDKVSKKKASPYVFSEDEFVQYTIESTEKENHNTFTDYDIVEIEDFTGLNIVVSGEFKFGKKRKVKEHFESLGAIVQKNTTLKTDIIIVGYFGNSLWKKGTYGSKIEKALDYNERRKTNIKIISESDVLK